MENATSLALFSAMTAAIVETPNKRLRKLRRNDQGVTPRACGN